MRRRRNRHRMWWVLGLVTIGAVVLALFTAFQAFTARNALQAVASDLERVAAELGEGEVDAARERLDGIQEDAATARANTRGPGWWLGGVLPVVGDDVAAVQTVTDVTDVVAAEVLPQVVSAAETLRPEQLAPRNGRISLRPIEAVAPQVVAMDGELRRQSGRVEAIDESALMPQLAGPVGEFADQLDRAAQLTERASYAVRLLPPMLGSDGARTNLLLFQNNAEIRATGGIPGSVAELRADRGRLALGRQGDAGAFGRYDAPAVRLTPQERGLYGDKMAMLGADINFTPDFPRTAEIGSTMWSREHGVDIDGVVTVDPVALSYLLEATGPVEVAGGPTLRADTAVKVLLSDVYLTVADRQAQDDYFASAAAAVFDAVASGQGDSAEMLRGLTRAVVEGRIYAWSADPREQALLEETAIAGAIPDEAEVGPFVGVFMNDGTASKLQYYLRHRVDVEPVACNGAGRQELAVTVTMSSEAPEDAAGLPPSVIGPRSGGEEWYGVAPGDMRVNVYLYAPVGGWVDTSAVDGEESPAGEAEHLGHPVVARSITLRPGETRELTYTVMTGLGQTGDLSLRVTPGAHGDGVGEVGASACGEV